jgi:hypothetical protein
VTGNTVSWRDAGRAFMPEVRRRDGGQDRETRRECRQFVLGLLDVPVM